MSKSDLRIDWATHAAAKYACENWHYSGTLPVGKQVFVGVWEFGKYVGCVCFGRGANRNMAGEFRLPVTECVELTRVALRSHVSTVSRIVSIAIKFLRNKSDSIRLVVSYADPAQGHVGGIYQAMNWVYIGTSRPQSCVVGMHKRTASSKFGSTKGLPRTEKSFKHKYVVPLDDEMRKQIEPLRKLYPKRVRSVDSDTTGSQSVEGGANPTRTL